MFGLGITNCSLRSTLLLIQRSGFRALPKRLEEPLLLGLGVVPATPVAALSLRLLLSLRFAEPVKKLQGSEILFRSHLLPS